ncbi:DUF4124 domain-containing protein [Neisseria iguanae]|uniref:DUF4124 domain-containing protein n=1 Tax=Neisseria iguanae TaxID=90242 RepID=A0A2P7U1Q5_9NEIS|nr:DUF4124 domain-containing protein [Neisseria iguanae]PSJ80833.1 DUF4124 domain-containing protein [Neisseria iguanae]
MKTTLTYTLLTLCFSLTAAAASADSVYAWRNTNGTTTYSDVPHRLQPARSNTMNIRTHTVYRPIKAVASEQTEGSVTEQQNQLNQKITEVNKQIEAQNQKIAEDNQAMKDDNCKAARLNRNYAESARTNNREALKQRYDADISKYCN